MPKINVYLPDELAAAVRDAQVPVSAVCQGALEHAVREVGALREREAAGAAPTLTLPAGLEVSMARFTTRARAALVAAQEAASSLHHNYVGTEHIVLGVLDEGSNLAVKVLEAMDVAPDDVRAELLGHLRAGTSAPGPTPFTPNATTALELAVAASLKLGHNYVGCEHLLLGLIDEKEGLGGSVLRRLGLESRVTRRAVATALSGFLHAKDGPPVGSRSRLDEILRRLDAIEQKLGG